MSKVISKRLGYGLSGFALIASFVVVPTFAYAATTSTTVQANIGSTISVSD